MRFSTILLLSLLGGAWTPAAEGPPVPPTPRWIPVDTVMTDEQFAVWVARLQSEIQAQRKSTPLRPAFGLLISSVREKSQATAAGIMAGDVITHLDGVLLPDTSSFNRWRKAEPQKMTLWTAAAGERVVEIKPGMVGFSQSESWSPLHGYLLTRVEGGAPWEEDLLLAAMAIEYDTRAAERALMRAQERGCTHPTWTAVAAHIALQMGLLTKAQDFAVAALRQVAANERLPVAKILYVALLAQGKAAEAQELTKQYDVISYEEDHAKMQRHLADSVESFRTALNAHPVMPLADLCAARVDEMDFARALVYLSGPQQRVAEDLARLDPDGDLVFQGKERTTRLNQDGALKFASHRDRLDLTRVGPVMRDLDMSITCVLENEKATFKTSMGAYAIGIADHHEAESSIMLRLRITEDSKIQVRVEGLPEYEIRRSPFSVYKPHRLQVRIRDHTMGVFVDDMTVYHGPLLENPATRQYGLDLYTRDLKGTWSDLHWRGVLAPQELVVPPVDAERPKPPPIGADNFF